MILTPAYAGRARSAATRAGYPIRLGGLAKLYALSKVARSNATRANYVSKKPYLVVGGVQVGEGHAPGVGVLIESLRVTDNLSSIPTTGSMTAYGWVPVEGADVILTLGSKNNLRREFAGTILNTLHRYVGDNPIARNMVYDSQLIDYSWALQRRKVSGRFTATTVGAIATSLMTSAPVGYTLRVDPDIAAYAIDEFTVTEQNLDDALGQLAKRAGGDWQCDYLKLVHLFFTDTVNTPPTLVNAVHKSMAGIVWTRDLSQVVTRVYVDAGGSDALEAIGPGATMIPVGTAAWYEAGGGVVLAGPQRVKYGGVDLGGGGSLVGPGAAPTAPVNALVVPGAGVTAGPHDYAVTFVTASGETIPSPRVSVVVGVVAPPAAAPVVGSPLLAGPGPDPGTHEYAITYFVPGSGETTPGPRVSAATGISAPPTTGPTPTAGAVGVGPDPGTHDYAVAFVNAAGQTTPGPIGGSITEATTPIASPVTGPTIGAPTSGGAVDVGFHWYAYSFVTAYGETLKTNSTNVTIQAAGRTPDPTMAPSTDSNAPGAPPTTGIGWNQTYYCYSYKTASGETLASPMVLVTMPPYPPGPPNSATRVAPLIGVTASPDPNVTAIVVYAAPFIGTIQYWLPRTLSNVTQQYFDRADSYGPSVPSLPSSNTTPIQPAKQTVPLSNIATGPAGTIARRVYRGTSGSGGPLKLVTTINNNSSTTYTDTTADSALGANEPTSNTGYVTFAVALSDIPRGDSSITQRILYRRSGGAGLRYLDTIGNNSSTTYTDTKANAALGAAPPSVNTATLQQIPLTIPVGPSIVGNRNVYRTKIGSSTLFFIRTLDNVVTSFLDTTPDAAVGVAAPTVNGANASQVQLSAIPLGAAAVTSRKIYRTAAGVSQLKLLATLGDNTTTAYLDALADGSLGVNAPTSDNSLLQQPTGNVPVGSTALPCASVGRFRAGGGWAIVGSQLVQYGGITGNSLIGIPASGVGSIAATISYNTTAIAAPLILGIPANGVGAIRVPIVKGDAVDLFIQVDDVPAQTALAAQLGGGADGVVEDEIQDRRLSATEARARARARLAQLAERDADGKVGIITVSYTCRDINTRAGATVTINLGPPINLRGDFLIQRVTISQFGHPHGIAPTYAVEASSVRFTFEELLRVIREAAA